MHGRKRGPIPPEKRAKQIEKTKKYSKILNVIWKKRREKEHTEKVLGILAKVLQVNTDFITLWNFRKEILLDLLNEESKERLSAIELSVTEACLRKSPKSYSVWYHRRWIVENGSVDLANEVELCNRFLTLDSRNFHCWDYRRFIVKQANISPQEEFEYTTGKIMERFSNYSAWHYRSKLLPQICETEDDLRNKINSEIEFLRQAFWTDPYDQSGWLYYRWLLSLVSIGTRLRTEDGGVCSENGIDMGEEWLQNQVSMCNELLVEEPKCKWCLLTKSVLLQSLPNSDTEAAVQEITEILEGLVELDGMRQGYYNDMRQVFLSRTL